MCTRMMEFWCLLAVLLSTVVTVQSTPMLMVQRPLYNNWCDLNNGVRNGSVDVRTAFAGMNISVAYQQYTDQDTGLSYYENSTGQWEGLLPSIMSRVAAAGGFQLNITSTPPYTTFSSQLEYNRYYMERGIDIMGSYITDMAERCVHPSNSPLT